MLAISGGYPDRPRIFTTNTTAPESQAQEGGAHRRGVHQSEEPYTPLVQHDQGSHRGITLPAETSLPLKQSRKQEDFFHGKKRRPEGFKEEEKILLESLSFQPGKTTLSELADRTRQILRTPDQDTDTPQIAEQATPVTSITPDKNTWQDCQCGFKRPPGSEVCPSCGVEDWAAAVEDDFDWAAAAEEAGVKSSADLLADQDYWAAAAVV